MVATAAALGGRGALLIPSHHGLLGVGLYLPDTHAVSVIIYLATQTAQRAGESLCNGAAAHLLLATLLLWDLSCRYVRSLLFLARFFPEIMRDKREHAGWRRCGGPDSPAAQSQRFSPSAYLALAALAFLTISLSSAPPAFWPFIRFMYSS